MDMGQTISKKIISWYKKHQRSLPWRSYTSSSDRDYKVLLSEFMLQQTKVSTVIPYFNKFYKKFRTIGALSKSRIASVLKLWEGLGYYSRVRNLKKTAQILEKNFNRRLPSTIEELKLLPGIGDYTSNAIMAIAFNKPFIPLDGNIERVIKRLLNLKLPKEITKDNLVKSKKILGNSTRASDYAQALMELGALICRPKNPLCHQCPLIRSLIPIYRCRQIESCRSRWSPFH